MSRYDQDNIVIEHGYARAAGLKWAVYSVTDPSNDEPFERQLHYMHGDTVGAILPESMVALLATNLSRIEVFAAGDSEFDYFYDGDDKNVIKVFRYDDDKGGFRLRTLFIRDDMVLGVLNGFVEELKLLTTMIERFTHPLEKILAEGASVD